MRTTILLMLTLVLALCAFGQNAPASAIVPPSLATIGPPTPTTPVAPSSWIVAIGAEITWYQTPRQVIPTLSIAGCWTSMCEISTLENGVGAATIRQEIGYLAKKSASGNAALIVLAGGQLTATTTTAGLLVSNLNLGGVGGGAAFLYDLGGVFKPLAGKGVKLRLAVRETAVTSLGAKPQYEFDLAYRFK